MKVLFATINPAKVLKYKKILEVKETYKKRENIDSTIEFILNTISEIVKKK